MKKIFKYFILLLACGMVPQSSVADEVLATRGNDANLYEARYNATLPDGSVLGFDQYDEEKQTINCVGVKSTSFKLDIPEYVRLDGKTYAISGIDGWGEHTFEQAPHLEEIQLPSTLDNLDNLPETLKYLYVDSKITKLKSSVLLPLVCAYVPSELWDEYVDDEQWNGYTIVLPKGGKLSEVSIHVDQPGQFPQTFLGKVGKWNGVNLLTVTGHLNKEDLDVFKRMTQLVRLDLSEAKMTAIPNYFAGNSDFRREGLVHLEKVSLPRLGRIGRYAFAGCYKLADISLPAVDTIGEHCFDNDYALAQIHLPEGLKKMDKYAFSSCTSLQKVAIPSTLHYLDYAAFYNCTALTEVQLHDNIDRIGDYAFEATQLSSIDLHRTRYLGCCVFLNVQSLREIFLPGSFNEMSYKIFDNCKNLKKVTCEAFNPPYLFDDRCLLGDVDMTDVQLFVPKEAVEKYRHAPGWKYFYNILPMEEPVHLLRAIRPLVVTDGAQIADDCEMEIDIFKDESIGTLEYKGSHPVQLKSFTIKHQLGASGYGSQYAYYQGDPRHPSLISHGPMHARKVTSVLKFPYYGPDNWYFISFPYDVKVSDITFSKPCKFVIRRYDGQNRADMTGDTWQDLDANSVMKAYEGYIMRMSEREVTFTFPAQNNAQRNNIFAKGDVDIVLKEYVSEHAHNRSWNLVGNPYPCFYNISKLDFSAPVTVWNRYYKRYDAYSPVDDDFVLFPLQAFFVQRPVLNAHLRFVAEGRQLSEQAVVESAKSKIASLSGERKLMNFYLHHQKQQDRTRIVLNEKALFDYELDRDASKMFSKGSSCPLLYTLHDGVRYAINERPWGNGEIHFGFFAPEKGEYTISTSMDSDEGIVLWDKQMRKKVVLDHGGYSFNAEEGWDDTRFVVILRDDAMTGIIEDGCRGNADYQLNGNRLTSEAPFSVYDASGRLVAAGAQAGSVELLPGVYVVIVQNVQHKIVIK